MSYQSVLLLTHEEDDVVMKQRLQAEAGNKTKEILKLQNYLGMIGAGGKMATLVVDVKALKASGTVTLDDLAADDTVVINGVTLTAKASPAGESQFGLGSTDDDAAANLVSKINAHSNALIDGVVTAEKTTDGVAEVTSITAVADESDSLDGTSFILQDEDGSVGFWIDTDDSGTTIPTGANAADRAVEITTIATDDSDETVATKIATAINADSKFSASADGAVVTVTCASVGARTDAADSAGGEATGFTIAVATQGVSPVVTLTSNRPGKMSNCITLSGTGGATASGARLTGGTDGTEKTYYFGGAA